MSQLQLSLFGEPVVKHGEQTLTFSTRKALALLIYLAVDGGIHTRKTLSESFWPELDAEHGRAALRATLLELRKLLERGHGPGEQAHLHIERDTLEIEQGSPLILDLRLVESISKQAGQVGRRGELLADQAGGELLAQLEQATRVARGPFLASFTLRDSQFFDDWTRQHREYWHLRVHQLFDALSKHYEQVGEVERAIETVSRWLGFDRLHEEGYRRLMRLRFSQGDRVGALRTYATCRAALADELQVQPEPETVALAKRLRHTAPLRQSPSQPSHLSTGQPPANLVDGPLLGRTAEFGTLIECYQRVHAGQPHLVLLQGEAGLGKTRLASEFVGWAQAQGAEILAGRALQTGSQLPYQSLTGILRRRLEQENAPDDLVSDVWLAELSRLLPELRERYPDLPVPSTDEALGHHRLLEAISRLVQLWAARHPLVLLLDDMQWAETATLDLVLYLARSLAERPGPVLLLLNLRTETAACSDLQSTWLMAVRRTRIPLTALTLAALTKEETRRFVQELAWSEQPLEAGNNSSARRHQPGPYGCFDYGEPSSHRETLASFADWLYVQTGGQPFYLVEMLTGLLEREIIVPSLQEKGTWALILRSGLLAQTPTGELIPSSARELIRSQLGRLTLSAWAVLVAGAVLGRGLTFERLCQVAQVDEQVGLNALEELLRSGLLCEGDLADESREFGGYTFPCELIRQVVYQEAGVTRQRLLQRRVPVVMQEEVENNRREAAHLRHPAPIEGPTPAGARKGQRQRVVAGAVSASRQWGVTNDSSDVIRRHAETATSENTLLAAWKRGTAEQAASAFPRSPPGSPARAVIDTNRRVPAWSSRHVRQEK
jgi:DNA-binding SARP family transcriptional activator